MFAKLAVAAATFAIDRPYDYLVPAQLEATIQPGMRALVPFGNGDRVTEGVVLSLSEHSDYEKCKELIRLVDAVPVLTAEQLQLAFFMRERYFCTVYQAARSMLPAGLWLTKSGRARSRDRMVEMARLVPPPEDVLPLVEERRRSAPRQAELLDLLCAFETLPVADLLHFAGAARSTLQRLVQQNLVELFSVEVYRRPETSAVERAPLPILNGEQQAVLAAVEAEAVSEAPVHLISGVTGSGKTSIYAQLIQRCLSGGRSAILLVPEIALTPQTLARFSAWFGDSIALLHSSLSPGERYDEWKRVLRGEARLVIGTRSAVFAPAQDLGLIIMDEEQEDSYRSESAPRYQTREVARFRCHRMNARLVLGSATPDLRSRYLAERGDYRLHVLSHRYNEKPLPEVRIVDMKKELKSGNRSLFSRPLQEALLQRIERGEQSILFLNRRGASKLVCCSECGYTYRCPHCSVSMTWHARPRRLMCHYCGFVRPLDPACPECGGALNFSGAGTQQAEEELSALFPGVGILRVDSDTVSPAGSHRVLFRRFEEEKIPLMIGTQMVAKGLNFDNVTLVGVLSADQSLYSNDFRAGERSFSLITQVVGRSGRADKPGEALIQTFTPGNEILRLAARQDYEGFFQREKDMRRLQNAPPFYDWVAFSATGRDEGQVIYALQLCRSMLEGSLPPDASVQILGPVPMAVVRVSDRYRYRLLLCCHLSRPLRQTLAAVLAACSRMKEMNHVTFYVENEPGA